MTDRERIIPGCGNHVPFTGVCRAMFNKTEDVKPSLAKEMLIDPPGAIEGPPSPGVKGLVCTVSTSSKLQKYCSRFITRTESDDLRDMDI